MLNVAFVGWRGMVGSVLMERMLAAGYATFAWDKPGTGKSTGRIDGSRVTEQRARIDLLLNRGADPGQAS